MAPARKSRSVNKRFAYPGEESPAKDVESGSKSKPRKRKLSDMLGPQWSKEELQRFYEAYRKYGKDWKKVATVVRNRTVEMVEALYTMNRAYLSLPEGTASVVGLIAMMTDHYSVLVSVVCGALASPPIISTNIIGNYYDHMRCRPLLGLHEGSDSEQESNDGLGTSRKTQKRSRGKLRSNTTRRSDAHFPDVSESQTAAPGYGCLSLLKKKRSAGSQTRAVGKRTPRFPIKYAYDKEDRETYFSPARQVSKVKGDADDDYVAHEVALALAEASHRGGSPQVSHTPNKRRDAVSSPDQFGERMYSESEMTSAKNIGNDADGDGCEGSLGSTDGDNGEHSRDRSFSDRRRPSSAVKQRGKKVYGKTSECVDIGYHQADDIKEACSGTEEGQKLRGVKRKSGNDAADTGTVRGTAAKKRSKKVLFGEEEAGVTTFDALQTLADLSLMMPTTTEPETEAQPKEEKVGSTKSRLWEAVPGKNQREKLKGLLSKKRDQVTSEVSEFKTARPGKSTVSEFGASPDAKESSMRKRKQKSPASKISPLETFEPDTSELQKELHEQGKKPGSKNRRSSHTASPSQPVNFVRTTEHSSSSTGPRKEVDDSAVSSIQAPAIQKLNVPIKSKSRRKSDKSQIQRNSRDVEISQDFVNNQSNTSVNLSPDRALILKEGVKRLSDCLSNYCVRRWCIFEWFYSAIDYPWFAKSEFVEYLYHVGLGHVPRLTRVEWGVIRSSLGKPRRFSEQFLKEEKEKLDYYRESVRTHYTELRTGVREGLPTDLACPLTVGQRVIAIHPRTREVHNGSVLTVDHNRCRVQFDRPELGVEFVMDIDCMPLNPSDNMPASLRGHGIAVDKFYESLRQQKPAERSEDRKEEYIKFAPNQNTEAADGSSYIMPIYGMNSSLKAGKELLTTPGSQAKNRHEVVSPQQGVLSQPSALAQIQAKEADVQALAELSRALDKKSALVAELKRMNDDVTEDGSLKDIETFKKQYAAVLVQLDEVFEQVSSALICLRQRNTYQGNSLLQWQKPISNRASIINSFGRCIDDTQESGIYISEIVETSKVKAQRMVEAAMQAMSSLKEETNYLAKIEEAVDYVSNHLLVDDRGMAAPASRSNGSLAPPSQSTLFASEGATTDHAPNAHLNGESDEQEIPLELITNCVATLLMIQKCTERQFPPADVAQILDFTVASLQPCCSQNLPVYTEIQKCMGIIRSQILALVPT